MVTQTTASPADDFGGSPDPWWRDGAERAVRELAATGRPFTIDALREAPYALPAPHSPGAWGALTRAMAAAGVIMKIGYVTSKAPGRNGGVVALWRGTTTPAAVEAAA